MLPGFRFLFAATMLSMSLLIFGLGAAALLRAAHESFASNSSWRAAQEIPFTQRPDTTMPVLATLRVEPNSFDKASEQVAAATPAPVDQPMSSFEPARNDQVAALWPAEAPPLEPAKPAELPTPTLMQENPPATEAVSPRAAATATEPAAGADERKVTVATSEATPAKIAPIKSEPVAAPASQPQADPAIATAEAASGAEAAGGVAAMKIATLGGPPVDVSDDASTPLRTVKLPRARPDQAAIKKRVQAQRAMHRRRLALRAQLMLQQQQANPFAQPQSFPPAAASH
jgi:hypothetical protein